ncbi:hypothetical protein MP228_005319 [Amoeboaphelidium protococcarum]|nr:hypothetical protein MP228_005319 [Amoeboaphelidium protococcarum]
MRLKFKFSQAQIVTKSIESAKWSKNVVLVFRPDFLSVLAPSPLDQMQTTSAFPCIRYRFHAKCLFESYVVESLADNQIALECPGDHLLRALKSSETAIQVQVKLTKRFDLPCLSFICSHYSESGSRVNVSQDVPCRVIPVDDQISGSEILWHPMGTSLTFRDLKKLRNQIDGVKGLSHDVTIAVNREGDCKFRVETASVQITSHFSQLRALTESEIGVHRRDEDRGQCSGEQRVEVEPNSMYDIVNVDSRALSKALNIHHQNNTTSNEITLNVNTDHGVILKQQVQANEVVCGIYVAYIPRISE